MSHDATSPRPRDRFQPRTGIGIRPSIPGDRCRGDRDVPRSCERGRLHELGGSIHVEKLDIASENDLDALAQILGAQPLDLLICNAAVFGGIRARFQNLDWNAWRSTLEINL